MKPSALHQHPQRDQSGQSEAEPTSHELVRIGQEEDTPAQRCDEHEEPGEATYTGGCAVISPAPASAQAYPFTFPVAGKLNLDLPGFEPGYDLRQRTRQRQQHSAHVEQLAEESLQCLFHTLGIKAQELACVGDSDFNEVELRGQSSRNSDQGANSAPGESKLRRDLKWLSIQQIADIMYHFGNLYFTHLTQRHPVIPLYHQRH